MEDCSLDIDTTLPHLLPLSRLYLYMESYGFMEGPEQQQKQKKKSKFFLKGG